MKFPEYKNLDLPAIQEEITGKWDQEQTFRRSVEDRPEAPAFVFFEGPPSANGMPGIHHVISRAIKDVVCRYKTQRGFKVERRAGWDTHGLPVELNVEKMLGITKEDIGVTLTVEEYNAVCRKEVMKYTREWELLTRKMAYWVDMSRPYVTYHNSYIETVWYLLSEIYRKGLLYKGYSIQPYSPAAGTGLSTHELNQPGCYKDVKDTTCTALFRITKDNNSDFLFEREDEPLYFLSWTTTPWTLPSNTALCVGPAIQYIKLRTFNPYSGGPISVIMARDLRETLFPEKNGEIPMDSYKPGDKATPWIHTGPVFTGKQLQGCPAGPGKGSPSPQSQASGPA